MNPLSELEARVFEELRLAPNTDVAIAKLFETGYGKGEILSSRRMQQRLGPLIARVNRKLDQGRIAPGKRKRTYCYYLKIES